MNFWVISAGVDTVRISDLDASPEAEKSRSFSRYFSLLLRSAEHRSDEAKKHVRLVVDEGQLLLLRQHQEGNG